MPPENNKKTNFDPLKVNLDPVFKGDKNLTQSSAPKDFGAGVYNTLTNQEFISSQPPREPSSFPPKDPSKIAIRTYKDDIQSAIQASHLSSVNIALAENEKMRSKMKQGEALEEKPEPVSAAKVKIIVAGIIILLVVGGLAIGLTAFINSQKQQAATQIKIPSPLITTDYHDELNIENIVKDRFISALASRLNDIQIPVNNIYNVYITSGASTSKRLVSTSELFDLALWQAPDSLKRNLGENYMVGMYAFGQNLPFVILKISAFENAYAGMLEWEKSLEKDFRNILRLTNNGEGGLALALTPGESRQFQDAVIANQDARVLKDENGKIFFVYSILSKDTIIFTVNETALKEIINRLNREKSLRR